MNKVACVRERTKSKTKKAIMDNFNIKKAVTKLRAISHPMRLSIIRFIEEKKEVNVSTIYHSLKIEQSVTSQQLKILRLAGMVFSDRRGKEIYYSLNYKEITHLLDGVKKLVKDHS